MESLQLRVNVEEDNADADRIDRLTRFLRNELLAAGVESVDQVSDGPAPPGTRGFDATTIGALMVATTSSAVAATQAITTIRGWLARTSKDSKVKISIGDSTLTLENPATKEQQDLITAFVSAALPTPEDA